MTVRTGILLYGIAALTWSCGAVSGQVERTGARERTVQVTTTTVQRISVQRTIDLAGNLASPDQAKVSSEVAGVVRDVLVQLGQEVHAGDALVSLDPQELKLALDRAESALRQTEAQLGIEGEASREAPPDDQVAAVRTALANRDDAKAQNARAEQLALRGLVSNVDLETTRTHLKVAEAAYEAAIETTHSVKASLQDRRAAYALAQKKLKDAVIRAPIAGAVSERLVQPGEFIREDTPVITIVKIDPLKVITGVQEKYASTVNAGMSVQFGVESFPNETFQGHIISVSPAVDQQTRTFPVEAELPNPGHRLKPGFFAKGAILTKVDQNVIAVPDDAVSTLAGVSTAYVIDAGKVRPQQVTLGVHQGKLVEIVSGLSGDEQLAESNLNQLSAGVLVSTGAEGSNPARGGSASPNAGRPRQRRAS